MRIKYALVALIGLFLGSIAGGIGVALIFADMTGSMVQGTWRDGTTSRFAEAAMYLRLLDEGKTDDLRKALVGNLQVTTIALAGSLRGDDAHLLRRQIEIAGRIPSVQADDSEVGKMAADARKRMLDVPQP
jgi:hypothetical protein